MSLQPEELMARIDRLEDNLNSRLERLEYKFDEAMATKEQIHSDLREKIGNLRGQVKIISIIFAAAITAIGSALLSHLA